MTPADKETRARAILALIGSDGPLKVSEASEILARCVVRLFVIASCDTSEKEFAVGILAFVNEVTRRAGADVENMS